MRKLLIAACALVVLPGAAFAQQGSGRGGGGHGGGWRGGGGGWHGGGWRGGGWRGGGGRGGWGARFGPGPVGRFGPRDFAAWRGGFWWHGYRGARFGWWWFANGFWYWYDAPVYPYPANVADYYVPSDSYAPAGPIWYYCANPAGYYPTVHACPSGWQPIQPSEGQPPQ
jgi:hypothetical protein